MLSQVEMEFAMHKTRQQERGIKNQSIRSEMDAMSAEIKALIADVKTAR